MPSPYKIWLPGRPGAWDLCFSDLKGHPYFTVLRPEQRKDKITSGTVLQNRNRGGGGSGSRSSSSSSSSSGSSKHTRCAHIGHACGSNHCAVRSYPKYGNSQVSLVRKKSIKHGPTEVTQQLGHCTEWLHGTSGQMPWYSLRNKLNADGRVVSDRHAPRH
jgi:hypothetical protein